MNKKNITLIVPVMCISILILFILIDYKLAISIADTFNNLIGVNGVFAYILIDSFLVAGLIFSITIFVEFVFSKISKTCIKG